MNDRPTAPQGALPSQDDIRWLNARGADRFRQAVRDGSRSVVRRMTATVGIGVMLSVGSGGSAFAPAAAARTSLQPATPDGDLELPPVEAVLAAPIVVAAADRLETPAPAGADKVDLDAVTRDLDDYRSEPQQVRAQRDPHEILRFATMRVPRWLVETILQASEVTGVCPEYMMALADKESSFSPRVKAGTSSAEGLFQFITATWLEVVKAYGAKYGLSYAAASIESVDGRLGIRDERVRDWVMNLRRDPYVAALMAGEMLKRDRGRIEAKLGRELTRSEFYLAHFLGVDSASRLMAVRAATPERSAKREFPAAARANKAIFYEKKGRKTRALSVAEVYDRIDSMIDKRIDRYTNVLDVASRGDGAL